MMNKFMVTEVEKESVELKDYNSNMGFYNKKNSFCFLLGCYDTNSV